MPEAITEMGRQPACPANSCPYRTAKEHQVHSSGSPQRYTLPAIHHLALWGTEPELTLAAVSFWADAEGRAWLISHQLAPSLPRTECAQPGQKGGSQETLGQEAQEFCFTCTPGGPGLKLWAEFAH